MRQCASTARKRLNGPAQLNGYAARRAQTLVSCSSAFAAAGLELNIIYGHLQEKKKKTRPGMNGMRVSRPDINL